MVSSGWEPMVDRIRAAIAVLNDATGTEKGRYVLVRYRRRVRQADEANPWLELLVGRVYAGPNKALDVQSTVLVGLDPSGDKPILTAHGISAEHEYELVVRAAPTHATDYPFTGVYRMAELPIR